MLSLNQLWERIENWMSSDEKEDHQFSSDDLDEITDQNLLDSDQSSLTDSEIENKGKA